MDAKRLNRKAVFLDRDGVLNEERGDYTYLIEDFKIAKGVCQALQVLKEAGFLLIVITNQGGIAKGLYQEANVWECHRYLEKYCNISFDDLYFSPYHPIFSASLSRKPDSLLLEKAIAKHQINTQLSWMIGDSPRDIEAAQKVALKTIKIGTKTSTNADFYAQNLWEASQIILKS
ncbi:MAG: HAD-IIIA family hydrolase [Thermonemataceae bacterium]|nr:HAD-IIIA family hydrolase [Thermonemataceae bacterium]